MVQLEILDVRRALQDARLEGFTIDRPRGGGVSEAPYLTIEGRVVGRASQAIGSRRCTEGGRSAGPRCTSSGTTSPRRWPASRGRWRAASGCRLPVGFRRCRDRGGRRPPRPLAGAAGDDRDARSLAGVPGTGEPPLVSVVIPCFGQARFVGEAIESALPKTHPLIEVVVVDDGSPDNVTEVAGRYPGVRCVRQDNGGLRRPATPHPLQQRRAPGVPRCRRPPAAGRRGGGPALPRRHTAGGLRRRALPLHAADGSHLGDHAQPAPEGEPYTAFLEGNPISVPCVVLFRRSLFEAVGCFDPASTASPTTRSTCARRAVSVGLARHDGGRVPPSRGQHERRPLAHAGRDPPRAGPAAAVPGRLGEPAPSLAQGRRYWTVCTARRSPNGPSPGCGAAGRPARWPTSAACCAITPATCCPCGEERCVIVDHP